jgi:DNA-binding HxlR family transcriptional regulator
VSPSRSWEIAGRCSSFATSWSRGYHTFKQFQESGERIASNILADRLARLEASGIITAEPEETDARRINYRLTEKGIDLAPVLLELLIWGARHELTSASCAATLALEKNREAILAEARRRWRERDCTPLIPGFDAGVARNWHTPQARSEPARENGLAVDRET